MTTADYLESLQNDLQTISEALNLEEGTNFSDIATMANEGEITKGGGGTKLFDGHYDTTGLTTIGWTKDDIQHYQENGVQWDTGEDDVFKLTTTELAGDESTTTRFIPKSTTKKSFINYSNLIGLPVIDLGSTTSGQNMFYNCNALTTIPLINTSNITDMQSAFYNCYSLNNMSLIDTSKVTNMQNTFYSCYSLKTIPLFDTSKVTNMQNMFNNCYSLEKIPMINTQNVTTTVNMFYNCYSLKSIPSLNLSKATTTAYMFTNCYSLKSIGKITTSSLLTNMQNMFAVCYNLLSLDLSGIDTSNVTNMQNLFSNCKRLTKIDMRTFDFTKVSNYNYMFGMDASGGPPNNCLIIVADNTAKTWITSKFSRLTNVQTLEEYEGNL